MIELTKSASRDHRHTSPERTSARQFEVRVIELVRRAVKVFRKPFDVLEVVLNGGLRVVTSLELVEHRLSEMGHRNLLVTHTLPDPIDRASRVASAAPGAAKANPLGLLSAICWPDCWTGTRGVLCRFAYGLPMNRTERSSTRSTVKPCAG